jgi:hypothetical protein
LLRESSLDLKIVRNAIERTFERRMTILPYNVPLGLSVEFATDRGKNAQWKAFLSKNGLSAPQLDHVVEMIWEKVRRIIIR